MVNAVSHGGCFFLDGQFAIRVPEYTTEVAEMTQVITFILLESIQFTGCVDNNRGTSAITVTSICRTVGAE
jgi:hypothetical protein